MIEEEYPKYKIKKVYSSLYPSYRIYILHEKEVGFFNKRIEREYKVHWASLDFPTLNAAIEQLKRIKEADEKKDGEWITPEELMLEQL